MAEVEDILGQPLVVVDENRSLERSHLDGNTLMIVNLDSSGVVRRVSVISNSWFDRLLDRFRGWLGL